MNLSNGIEKKVKEVLGTYTINVIPVQGGCINKCYRLVGRNAEAFIKINSASKFPSLFRKEANGLMLLGKPGTIAVPNVVLVDEVDEEQLLILQWIQKGEPDHLFWTRFGEQLAAMHQATMPYFGHNEDNFMGSVPQDNSLKDSWCPFFIENRIEPLLDKCIAARLLAPNYRDKLPKLYSRLPDIFPNEPSSLVHGDLWSGNFICNDQGQPVIIDPAAHYGHCAADLGMTTLFGGFDKRFYEAYQYYSPLDTNHLEQWEVCNLYPLLIHLLLFGKSYLSRIEWITNKYE
jgi:fructosamine-3-kinase